jgi:hypothetical protein
MAKRLCRKCGKALAEANKSDECFCHQTGMVIKERTPATLCTSYNTGSGDQPGAPDMYLKPGDIGYNELAFSEDVVGAIDEDGESIYEIDLGGAENQVAEVYAHPDKIITEDDLAAQDFENEKFKR